jgi:aspartate/methionine/tyrosine aminotransferase
MKYKRMPIEIESPEEFGYSRIQYNLSESSIADQRLSDLDISIPSNLLLLYAEHRGSARLRSLIAEDNVGIGPDDVLITGGAASALFIIATGLLGRDDHLVVVRPNYATNIETPRAIGCEISYVDLSFERGFRLDFDGLASSIRANTRLISVTNPHNPTGTMLDAGELRRLVALAKERNCHLLVDETYRDLSFGDRLPVAAALGDHVISVSSLSKAYGVPGLRVGWLISRSKALQEVFLAAKEQISICGSVIDEWVAEQILAKRQRILNHTLNELRSRLDLIGAWIDREPSLEWVRPAGGVVCFPRMNIPTLAVADFYERLIKEHGTYVGPGHWFEMPDTFFRLGYGWPTQGELEGGLDAISKTLKENSRGSH